MVKDNILLGEFDLADLPPAPRGGGTVEVTFEVDVNAMLNISATDLQSGISGCFTLQSDQHR